ncbi:hypothetical protein U14_03288 [Candidatus Moduliflexus flocculans]|uniref:DUF3368 domain-containing protein n=1 Tax=Candidatus Moduliflexus flocculans TaxID=1499966 RepID=A0A081BNS5_9BACT|nr:hypothetical protein U14_03288 [Candidatus Moduliflexus flocculans]
MIVISNSSPIIALSRIQRLDIFQQLFGKVIIPPIVYQEVAPEHKSGTQYEHIHNAVAEFIEVIEPQTVYAFTRNLQQGERGVLNLALELNADMLIIDDRKARNEAREMGIRAVIALTVDILKQAEARQIIPSYIQIIAELRTKNIFLPA